MRGMPPFDAVMLLHEYGDEGLVRDLARLVVETTPAQIDAVRCAVDANDGAALRAAAHKLRGSIVTFGMAGAVATARKLEEMAVAGDLGGADALSRQLVADVQSLRDSARAWLEGGAALP
jgi:HPt (histidine-containing phosphotransfer) domain-containing protein